MKRHSIVLTTSCVSFLMLPITLASCGSENGGDLFVDGKPQADAGNTGATGGTPATGGASGAAARGGSSGAPAGGTGSQSSGGSAGTSDASAGASGTNGAAGTAGMTNTNGAGGSGGTAGIAGANGTAGTAGSNGTAGTAGSSGTAGTAGSSGTAGTAGSGGTAGIGNPDSSFGAGGTAGTSGSAGTVGADAGSDASADGGPKSCTSSSQCKSDEFCSKAACVNLLGECKPRPKICAATESPVCGCDGVNYWNDCLRQQLGSPSSTSGECLTPATCGGIAGLPCQVGRAHCAHLLTTELQCTVSDAFGACWVIPEQCPQIVVGANQRACSGSTDRCVSRCEAIKTEHAHFTDSTCPQ